MNGIRKEQEKHEIVIVTREIRNYIPMKKIILHRILVTS